MLQTNASLIRPEHVRRTVDVHIVQVEVGQIQNVYYIRTRRTIQALDLEVGIVDQTRLVVQFWKRLRLLVKFVPEISSRDYLRVNEGKKSNSGAVHFRHNRISG